MTDEVEDKTFEIPASINDDAREDVKHKQEAQAQNLPSRADWQRLYQAADAFRELRPWEWADDDRVFGVKCPETGEIYYCCVLGALKEVYALVAYEGAEGLDGYRKILSGEIRGGPLALEYQRCLFASFEDRDCLEPRDRAVIRELGRKYRGRNTWPLFRHYMPGYFPWHLSAIQARSLAACLDQAVDVIPRYARDHRLLAVPGAGRHLVRVLETSTGGKAEWHDKTIAPALLHRAVPKIPINEIGIARLCRHRKKLSGDWEIGYCYSPTCIQEHPDQRPYLPRLLGIVDAGSGFILSMGFEAPDEHLPLFRDTLISCLEKAEQWPQHLLVNHENTGALAAPIAKALGITLKRVHDLPNFAMVYEHMLRSMCR